MQNKPKDVLYCGIEPTKLQDFPISAINAGNLDTFLYFIKERYNIHLRKDVEQIKYPYTSDKILRYYRFTNVRREHDKNTKWVIKHICTNPDLKYGQKLVNIVLFRIFNKIETAELLHLPLQNPLEVDAIQAAEHIENSLSDTPFTGAYLCSGMKRYMKDYTGTESNVEAALLIVQEMCEDRFWKGTKRAHSPQDILEILQQYAGISEFMSYQIFVDFTYIDEFPFSENEFTIAGIGARSGLKLLFGKRCKLTPEELIFWMRDNWNELNEYNIQCGGKNTVEPKFLMRDLPADDRVMNVMSLENCLCEFSKYYKACHRIGRPRQKYKEQMK